MAERLDVERVLEELKRQRDELRVKMHLAKAEVRDEWAGLEHKWEHVKGRLTAAGGAAGEAAEDVGAALRQVAEELKRGYDKIRRQL